MTGSKEVLHDLKQQLIQFSQVTIGDGSQLKVLGHGKMVISPDVTIELSSPLVIIYFPSFNFANAIILWSLGFSMCLFFTPFLLK